MRRRDLRWPAALLAVGVLITGFGCDNPANGAGQLTARNETEAAPRQAVLDLELAFQDIAERASPAVVSLTTTRSVQPMQGQDLSPFGRSYQMPAPRNAMGTGSGFIIREDGWILTNDHVVSGADRVTVRLDDGREFEGTVRRDFRSDLAVVKIEATGLPTLEIADSAQVKVGSWAIAYGSPFGLEETMTVGIVSALGRASVIGTGSPEERYYPELLQTDASINPGNSGGPLLDINGRVIGVNVAINSPTGVNAGIGFAIPSATARYVMEQLIEKGTVTRGYLGFVPQNLSASERKQYGVESGALVVAVDQDSPASQAGIQVEDVVIRYRDQQISNEAELRTAITRTAPGEKVQIVVRRGGNEQTVDATVGSAPDAQQSERVPQPQQPTAQESGRLGIQVGEVTPEVAQRFGLPQGTTGVVVGGVAPGSPAGEAGLRPGDLLLRVNNQEVRSPADVPKTLENAKAGDTVGIVFRRGNTQALARVLLR